MEVQMFGVRRRISKRAIAVGLAAVALVATVTPVASAAGAAPSVLLVSSSADRSNPVRLSSATIRGNAYVFVARSNVAQVSFYLDSPTTTAPLSVEQYAPYDLARTAPDGSANALDTTRLADGSHSVVAVVKTTTDRTRTYRASFNVRNTSTTPTTTTPNTTAPATSMTTTRPTTTSTSTAPATTTSRPPTTSTTTPTTTSTTRPPSTTTTLSAPGAFPDASNTGWKHTGATLKSVPSQTTTGAGWHWESAPFNYVMITDNNAVVDSLDINGCVYINEGVTAATIQRSRINGNCDYSIRTYDANTSIALKLTDVELVGGAVQYKGAGFTFTRVDSHGFSGKAAMLGSNSTVQDSYIHDQVCRPPDHQSAVGTNGGASNMVIRHNTIDLTPSECVSGGIANYDDFGAFHNIVIDRNLVNSGGYCLKAGFEDNNAAGNSGMQVTNNVFGQKYFKNCGSYGVVSNWMPNVSGNVWSGNRFSDGTVANP